MNFFTVMFLVALPLLLVGKLSGVMPPDLATVMAIFRPRYRQPIGATLRSALMLLLPAVCAVVIALPEAHPWAVAPESGNVNEARLAGGFLLGFFFLLSWCGFSIRNDVIERDNPAATLVVVAAALAPLPAIFGLIEAPYIGAFWGTALGTMAASWFLLELVSRISEKITVDRDLGSALRLAAFLLAMALSSARALQIMGEEDNFLPYPVAALVALVPLLIVAMAIEWWKRVPRYPLAPLRSLPIAALYLALGAGGAMIFR